MSTNTSTDTGTSSGAHVTDLLEQRTRIQSWLDNLETVGAEANTRVVERVRADYRQRLGAILDELAGHVEAIRSDREKRQSDLSAATKRLDKATEELEEARLRHMIGEISDDEWRDRQPDLGDAVTEAEADRDDARAEVERLDDLLRQIEEDGKEAGGAEEAGTEEVEAAEVGTAEAGTAEVGTAETDPDSESDATTGQADGDDAGTAPPSETVGDTAGTPAETVANSGDPLGTASEDVAERMVDLGEAGAVDALPELRPSSEFAPDIALPDDAADDSDLRIVHSPDPLAFLSELPGSDDERTVEQPLPGDRDLDFLRDLDRAISGEEGEAGEQLPAPESSATEDEDPDQFRPTPGTKCPECGYTNDPEAWYCGVCGVDLA
jgi:hypothetical protein